MTKPFTYVSPEAHIMALQDRVEYLERVMRSIATDCQRGAHDLGMTPAGVQDIVSRINRTLKQ